MKDLATIICLATLLGLTLINDELLERNEVADEEMRGRVTKLEDSCTKLYKSVQLLQRNMQQTNEGFRKTQDIILKNQGVLYVNQKAFNVRISALEERRPIRTLPKGE